MFENPRRGRQARNFTTNVPKILDLKSFSEQIFSENWRCVPLSFVLSSTSSSVDTTLFSDKGENRWFTSSPMLSTCADTTLIGRTTTHIFSRRREHSPSSVVSFMGWMASEGFIVNLIQSCLITVTKEERKNTHTSHTSLQRNPVADPGEGPREPAPLSPPPLFLDQNEARRAEKKSFGDRAAPFVRVWMTGAPLISRSRPGTDFLHVRGLWFCLFYMSLLVPLCSLCLVCIWRLYFYCVSPARAWF